MTKKIESWVKVGSDVCRATSDDTRREFYENTFLLVDFNDSFTEQLRLQKDVFYLLFAEYEGNRLTKWNAEDDEAIWTTDLSGVAINSVKVDSKGRAIIAVGNYVRVIDKSGQEVMAADIGEKVNDVDHDNSLNLVAGTDSGTLVKIDSEGNVQWTRTQKADGGEYRAIYNVSMKSNGQILLVMEAGSYGQVRTVNSDGSAWINAQDDDRLAYTFSVYVITDSQDNIYIFEHLRF